MSLEININAQLYNEIIVNSSLNGGFVPQKYHEILKKERADKRLIIVAAAPKSGSTFLSGSLCKISGYKHYRLTEGYDTNEHDLCLANLLMMNRSGCVSQLHMKGTYHNASHIQSFGIKPIILVRNIFDTVISLVNDLRKKQNQEGWKFGRNGYSFIWQDDSTKELSDTELTDMVIDLALPWYINFYVSWYRLCQNGIINGLWITYEDLMNNKEGVLQKVISFLELNGIDSISKDILDKKYGTFREGNSGAGDRSLTDKQKEIIEAKFKYYQNIDFGMYGV